MFSELPKLFDRDFAVGFFLPGAVLSGAIFTVLNAFGISATPQNLEALAGTAIAIAVVWLVSVTLLAMNFGILRFLEGYPKWYPFRSRQRTWKLRFRKTAKPMLRLQEEIDKASDDLIEEPLIPDGFEIDLRRAVENFPDAEELVLPTEFGNTFRALEVYSRVVYGIDAIPTWPRLQAVMPEQFKKQLAEAKSLLDFSVNLVVGGTSTTFFYFVLAVWMRDLPSYWLPIAAIVISIGSYRAALVAVRQYGAHVKSAFDLYRGELAKQLGLEIPRSPKDERDMWETVSRVLIFRSSAEADLLMHYRPSPDRIVKRPAE